MKKDDSLEVSSGYADLLTELKSKIQTAQVKAALAVNAELVRLYWEIGNIILQKLESGNWGAKIVERLARDLKAAFPDMKGFSFRNLKYMRQFAETYPDLVIGQQPVAQIPWGHNVTLLDKLDSQEKRLWYARKAAEYGWSRNIMVIQIETRLYERQATSEKISNFSQNLPAPQSDLAQQLLKDPYVFDVRCVSNAVSLTKVRKNSEGGSWVDQFT